LGAGHDLEQRVALRGIGALVDDELQGAVALVHRTGPAGHHHHPQPVEPHGAEMPLLDLVGDRGAAIPVGRQGVELTRTTIIAVAVGEFRRLDPPIGLSHRASLVLPRNEDARSREARSISAGVTPVANPSLPAPAGATGRWG